ncbi:ANR family transcriptional regulator [Yersinia enterocolitica]
MSFQNHDSPLYYQAAREAAQIEREGDYRQAAKVWTKAARTSRNPLNQEWSENRSDFCIMQIAREKFKEGAANGLHP